MEGCVFDIQRFSVHDGPGIRTTVFLKGCPLHCAWCSNPESQSPRPELLFQADACIGCGKCLVRCTSGAVSTAGFDRSKCTGCGQCTEECYAEARYLKGRYMTPEQVLAEVVRDRSFYDRTGGGVTFSGGEPLTQPDFLVKLLQCCREAGIGTAIETCGCAPWESFAAVVPLVDVFLYDIKHLDSAHHRAYTGAGCEQIVANCRHLAKVAKRLIIRVPVIPQFNFDLESLRDIVRFAETLPVEEVDFLPYHRMAENKYRYLGRDYWAPGPERLTAEEVGALVGQIVTPLKCKIGG